MARHGEAPSVKVRHYLKWPQAATANFLNLSAGFPGPISSARDQRLYRGLSLHEALHAIKALPAIDPAMLAALQDYQPDASELHVRSAIEVRGNFERHGLLARFDDLQRARGRA